MNTVSANVSHPPLKHTAEDEWSAGGRNGGTVFRPPSESSIAPDLRTANALHHALLA